MNRSEIQRLIDADRNHVWHPFTQMRDWLDEDPLIIERAEGVLLIDVEGNRYIDGVSSLWTNVHGHGVRELDETLRAQIGKVAHSTLLGLSNVPSIELARELAAVAPGGLSRVFYSDSGSTAVEVALKMAFQYWQQAGPSGEGRTRFACLGDAYHGDTIGSVSVGGIGLFHAIYKPLLFETISLPSPYCYRCPHKLERSSCGLACAERAAGIIEEHRDELAAVVMEPLVQGAGGIIVHPRGFLEKVAAACRKNDVLLILDEVATGFGRTGRLFACEHEGVEPDFLALAKGLSGGYLPLAATVTTDRVFEGFLGAYESRKTFFHGHTFTGNPLACAAALASLDRFQSTDLLGRVSERAKELENHLEALARLPHVGEVRQQGLMAGIELVKDTNTREPFEPGLRVGHQVIMEARKRGAILRPLGDVLVVMPPLSIASGELTRLASILHDSMKEVLEVL